MALPDLILLDDLWLGSWRRGWTLDGPIPDACSLFPSTLARLLFNPDVHLPILRSFSTTLFTILILSHGLLLALVLLSPRWYYYPKVGLGRLIDG